MGADVANRSEGVEEGCQRGGGVGQGWLGWLSSLCLWRARERTRGARRVLAWRGLLARIDGYEHAFQMRANLA
eukprot:3124944-Pleurochrysis_carterae.AAC.1